MFFFLFFAFLPGFRPYFLFRKYELGPLPGQLMGKAAFAYLSLDLSTCSSIADYVNIVNTLYNFF